MFADPQSMGLPHEHLVSSLVNAAVRPPPIRKLRQASPTPTLPAGPAGRRVRRDGLLVLASPLLLGLPLGATFDEDALEEPIGGLVFAALGPGKLRLGGDQLALAGGLENAGPVALQVGLGPFEGGYGGVQPGELLLDFGDDAVLFGEGWE